MLRLADLRHEVLRFLPRAELDTCLFVNRLWSADVNKLSDQLALRELKTVEIIYVSCRFTRKSSISTRCFRRVASGNQRGPALPPVGSWHFPVPPEILG